MDLMPRYPDKFFSLAIVDPPYGHAMTKENYRGRNHTRFGGTFDKYGKMKISRTGGTWQTKYEGRITQWDIAPGPDYFKELFRVADKVIIWGGNYFNLPPPQEFYYMAEINHIGRLFNGNGGICLDKYMG
jgi:site-specific DNA-methyltransferase (adenine-specific)